MPWQINVQVSRSCRFRSQRQTSKRARSDPEAFWLGPVMAIAAIERAARIGPDRTCRIRFPASFSVPVLQRRHWPYCAKPNRIPSGWPGQGLAKHIWSESKPVYRNHQARFLAGRNRPATMFPTFRLGSVLPQTSWIILYKTSPGPI